MIPAPGISNLSLLAVMMQSPILDEWRTDWHLVCRTDRVATDRTLDILIGGIRLHVSSENGRIVAHSDDRSYPVMVVDDEIFVLLSDAPR